MAQDTDNTLHPLPFFNLNRQVLGNMSDDLFSSRNARVILENYFKAYLVVSEEEAFFDCANPGILQSRSIC